MNAETNRSERTEIYHNICDGIIPKRVPIEVTFSPFSMAEYAGVDPRLCYWDPSVLEEKAMEIADRIHSDTCPFGFSVLHPARYEALGSKAIVMASNGFVQHPNTHMMESEEYDEFIEDPLAFIIEKALPRVYTNLDYKKNAAKALMTFTVAEKAFGEAAMKSFMINGKLDSIHGYYQSQMAGGGYAPFDILTDELRSFSGMLTDIRRKRDKVLEAVEAISPLNYFDCRPEDMKTYNRYAAGSYSLHMATYMRIKDFEELYWPSYKRQLDGLASEGVRSFPFLEDDWTRLLDYVQDLPVGTELMLENTDPKLAKEKLGKKFILSGGFPIEYLTQCTSEEAADKAKEWIELMAPGGNYIFTLNKGILCAADCKIENLEAVVNTVLDRGVYSNAGERTGMTFNKDDYSPADLPPIRSRAFTTWNDYLAANPYTPPEAEEIIYKSMKNMIFSVFFLLK